jgi:hypothetical protein
VEDAFRTTAALRETRRFTPSIINAIAGASRFSPVVVSGCDLKVLKVFVASDWVPVVILSSPVGPKHARAVVGYDDSAERLTLVDPITYAKPQLVYREFLKQWDDPQKTCLLVFAHYVGAGTTRSVLSRYLSEEKVKSISIMVPKRR